MLYQFLYNLNCIFLNLIPVRMVILRNLTHWITKEQRLLWYKVNLLEYDLMHESMQHPYLLNVHNFNIT